MGYRYISKTKNISLFLSYSPKSETHTGAGNYMSEWLNEKLHRRLLTVSNILYREDKTQKANGKRAGCSYSAVSIVLSNTWDEGQNVGVKRCSSNRNNCSQGRTVERNLVKHWGSSQGEDWGWSPCFNSHYTFISLHPAMLQEVFCWLLSITPPADFLLYSRCQLMVMKELQRQQFCFLDLRNWITSTWLKELL